MTWIRPAGAVALLLALAACAPDDDAELAETAPASEVAPAAPTAPAELEAAWDRSMAAWNQEDPAALAAYFTENATVVNEDTVPLTGRQQIQAEWLSQALPMMSDLEVHDVTWAPVGQDYRASGRYSYKAAMPEGESTMGGTFENTWTRDADGQWRISSMRTRSDPAPAGPGQ